MRASSTPLVNELLLALGGRDDMTAWRNNTGALKTDTGRVVHFGLPGSPDIIGFSDGGYFLAIECKAGGGRLSRQQRTFRDLCFWRGVIYVEARSVEQAVAAINKELELRRRSKDWLLQKVKEWRDEQGAHRG